MNKKFLSLVLALVMVLGTFGNVFAAAATDKKEVKDVPKLTSTDAKVQWLIDNKIVVGTADKDGKATGDKDLTSPIRRDAAAKMLVYAVGAQDLAAKLQGAYRPFPDVATTNIMNGLIAAAASTNNANGVPIISGYEDGMFRPTKNVTYAELAKMLVVAIDKDLTFAKAQAYDWPQGWLDRAAQLGIFDGLSIDKANDPAVRREAFAMIYNAFYELKEVKAVPSNETRGIISERSKADSLVLNQGEFKKEFKVNDDTIYVNLEGEAKLWKRDFNEKYYLGSLVRVLADKDGVVTHIIEMGNPVQGVNNEKNAWVDLGKVDLKTISSFKEEGGKAVNKLAVEVGKDFVKIDGKQFDVTDKTEFYVADYDKDALTKVKDFQAAKDLLADKVKFVYLGYEALPLDAGNEARVVVFNEVDKEANERTYRVVAGVSNQDYNLSVQAPGENETKTELFSLRDNSDVWPYDYGLDALDVIKVTNDRFEKKDVIIDHSETDEFPVVKINQYILEKADGTRDENVSRSEANIVELIDKDDYTEEFVLPNDYDTFFGKDLKVGAHVQYALKDDTNKIDVLSYVGSEELDGALKGGEPSYYQAATVDKITEYDKGLYRVVVFYEDSNKETVLVAPKELVEDNPKLEEGKKYDLLLEKVDKDYELEIVKFKLHKDQVKADEFIAAVNASTNTRDYATADPADLKAELEDLIKKYKALSDDEKDLVEKQFGYLNQKIDAYNALDGVAEADKLKNVK